LGRKKRLEVGSSVGELYYSHARAGTTLANNSLEGVPKLLRIGRATMKIVKLKIAFALVVNAIGIYLSTVGFVTPLTDSIIHEGNALLGC
jgi:cation transport ATPase